MATGTIQTGSWRYVGGASGSTVTQLPTTNDWTEVYIEAYFPGNQQISFNWTRPRISIPGNATSQGAVLSAGYSATDNHACLIYCSWAGVYMYGYWRNQTSMTASYKIWVK